MKEQILNNLVHVSIFIGIVLITFLLAFLVNRFFTRLIRRSTQIIQNDPTNYQFLKHTLVALVYVVGFSLAIYMMPNLRAIASSLLAGAGILAVAVGFASQHALSNIISGFFIVIFKPFRVNDHLIIRNSLIGVVEDITLRHTVIRNFENQRIIIPNAIISDEIIINSDFTDGKICKRIDIRVSYGSNLDQAKKIIQEEAEQHRLNIDLRTPKEIKAGVPKVLVRVLNLGEYSVNLRAWAWAKNSSDGFEMSCDLYESIKKRFDKEGIEIPFPRQVVIQRNKDETIA